MGFVVPVLTGIGSLIASPAGLAVATIATTAFSIHNYNQQRKEARQQEEMYRKQQEEYEQQMVELEQQRAQVQQELDKKVEAYDREKQEEATEEAIRRNSAIETEKEIVKRVKQKRYNVLGKGFTTEDNRLYYL